MTDAKEDEANRIERAETGVVEPLEREKLRKRILHKLDTRVVPILAVLFLCSFLDRTNVGNAKIIGLEHDLNLSNHQYEVGLAVFYATYIAVEIPSNLILKKLTPKFWLPFITFAWGVVSMCLGFVRNYSEFVGVRALLGLTEGGLFPGIVFYLSTMYKREELALRIGLFYTASGLAGAFGGLLARGLATIGPRGGLEGWRWILIIEGLATILVAFLAYFGLPASVQTAHFLTEQEREYAVRRLHEETSDEGRGAFKSKPEHEEEFSASEVRRGLFNLQVWLTGMAYFAILSGLYSFSLFIPTIINALGIAKNPNEAQLYTVIPYAVATPPAVLVAFISDRLRIRGLLILFLLPISIIGYAVIANTTNPHTKLAMTCLMGLGMYSAVPCLVVWNSNNSAGYFKRASSTALQVMLANCGGFVATFNYPSKQAPKFYQGHMTIMGLLVFAWVFVFLNVLNVRKINRDKENGKYDRFKGCGDDRDPAFRMVL